MIPRQASVRTLLGLCLLMLSASAQAVLEITITEGVVGARPIAVVPFQWEGEGRPPLDVAEIVETDLARSGEFSPVERGDLITRPGMDDDVRYGNWRTIDTDHLVVGGIERDGDDYRIRFRLYDVLAERQLTGYTFTASENALRRVAHEISDILFEEITGDRGAFSTRIAFVTREGNGDDRRNSLQIADYDGVNGRSVLESRHPIMSPAWSPDGERLAYVSFENDRRPAVFVHDVRTGERRRISDRIGINSAPAWSPDGARLAITLSHEDSPSIYVVRADGSGSPRRVTHGGAIDTSPAWTPAGDEIIFTSDRAGNPQIYRTRADGRGQVQRLTFDGRYNAAPDVSPDGERIAFIHRTDNGHYRVAVQDLDGGSTRVLTNGRSDDSVSFAPNGRMILYSTRHDGRDVLGAVSVDGRAEARLEQTAGNVRDPAWGPFRD